MLQFSLDFLSTFELSLRNYNPLVILFWYCGLTLPENVCYIVLSLYICFTKNNVLFHLTSMYHAFLIQIWPPYRRTFLMIWRNVKFLFWYYTFRNCPQCDPMRFGDPTWLFLFINLKHPGYTILFQRYFRNYIKVVYGSKTLSDTQLFKCKIRIIGTSLTSINIRKLTCL